MAQKKNVFFCGGFKPKRRKIPKAIRFTKEDCSESPHRNLPHGFVSAQPHKTTPLSTAWGPVVCYSILLALGEKSKRYSLYFCERGGKKAFPAGSALVMIPPFKVRKFEIAGSCMEKPASGLCFAPGSHNLSNATPSGTFGLLDALLPSGWGRAHLSLKRGTQVTGCQGLWFPPQ